MGTMASQITSLAIVYSTVYSGADKRKHQSSASLAFVWGIHRGPVNSPHKWPVTREMFPFDDVIMCGVIFAFNPPDRCSVDRIGWQEACAFSLQGTLSSLLPINMVQFNGRHVKLALMLQSVPINTGPPCHWQPELLRKIIQTLWSIGTTYFISKTCFQI